MWFGGGFCFVFCLFDFFGGVFCVCVVVGFFGFCFVGFVGFFVIFNLFEFFRGFFF